MIAVMRMETPKKRRLHPARALPLLALALLGTASVAAQDIRIKVLNGRNGHPVTDQCLNVWVEGERLFDAVIATDSSGIAVFHAAGDPNNTTKGRCRGVVVPYRAIAHAESIQTFPVWPFDCQPYKKIGPQANSPPPPYSVRQILTSGLVAGNSCGKVKVLPKPGELVIFTRPLRPWEWIVWAWEQ